MIVRTLAAAAALAFCWSAPAGAVVLKQGSKITEPYAVGDPFIVETEIIGPATRPGGRFILTERTRFTVLGDPGKERLLFGDQRTSTTHPRFHGFHSSSFKIFHVESGERVFARALSLFVFAYPVKAGELYRTEVKAIGDMDVDTLQNIALTVTPIPAALALMAPGLLGLGGLAWATRRRRQAAAA